MSLSEEIRALRDRALADLVTAHDYYADIVVAWDTVLDAINGGMRFSNRNVVTGTVTSEAELAAKAGTYVVGPVAESTFQSFIAIFESFWFDLLRLWLTAYPQILTGKKVDFRAILEAPDKDAIIQLAVEKEINEVLYERPAGWFAYLEDKAKLGCPTVEEIERIAEAKATRDVLAHNRGIATKLYVSKAGRRAQWAEGERIEILESYHRAVWELLTKVVADVSSAAIRKVAPAPGRP